ncbi:MAG: S9 family peptidase, partial [Mycobacterium sp.]|nr:S9 family peptidase [Mycobacterium sp.]
MADVADTQQPDPYLWLEEISGDDALTWVREHNEPTLAEFGGDRFEQMRSDALEVLDTDARIPYVRRRGEYLYNFWRDAANPRGLWRRTTLESYRSEQPDWDVVIDVDRLALDDDTNWVWAGADVIEPDHSAALITLSAGGSDAAVVREFDMNTRTFVEGGFQLPEAKSQISWEDPDTVLVGTDFGEGSLTDSGYPRLVKRWRRGQPLTAAETVFSGAPTDVVVAASVDRTVGFERTMVSRALDFFNQEVYELRAGELIRIDAPTDSSVSVHHDWLLIELRTEWCYRLGAGVENYPAGSLLAADYDEFLSGTAELQVVFTPDEHTCLHHYAWTRDRLVVVTLADVASHVEVLTPGTWTAEPVTGLPENTDTTIVTTDSLGDEIFLDAAGFDTPSQLLYRGAGEPAFTPIKRAPSFFDAADIEVAQHFATSDDGTSIPYFV